MPTLAMEAKKAFLNEYDDSVIDVIVNRDTAEKYARRMNRLGYFLTAKTEYDMFTYKLTYQAVA